MYVSEFLGEWRTILVAMGAYCFLSLHDSGFFNIFSFEQINHLLPIPKLSSLTQVFVIIFRGFIIFKPFLLDIYLRQLSSFTQD